MLPNKQTAQAATDQGTTISTRSVVELVSRAGSMVWSPWTGGALCFLLLSHLHISAFDLIIKPSEDFTVIGET